MPNYYSLNYKTQVSCIPFYLISYFIYRTTEAEQNQQDKINTQIVFSSLWGEKMQFTRKMQLYINIYETKKSTNISGALYMSEVAKNNTKLDYLINY